MSDKPDVHIQPVPRDTARYKLLFSNSPARMPENYKANLDDRSTYEIMLDRDNQKPRKT